MVTLKIVTILVSSALYFIGGEWWHNARRYILPIALMSSLACITNNLFVLISIVPLSAWLTIGYGEKSLLNKYLGDAGARGIYLSISCLIIGSTMMITGHLVWILFILYCLVAGILGGTLRNAPIWIGDPIFGLALSSILFLVRP